MPPCRWGSACSLGAPLPPALAAHAAGARSPFAAEHCDAGGGAEAPPAPALLQAALEGLLRAAVRAAFAARGASARLLLGRLAAERRAAAGGGYAAPDVLAYVLHRLTAGLGEGGGGGGGATPPAPPPAAYAGAVADAVLGRAAEGDGDALATPAGLLLLAPGLAGSAPPRGAPPPPGGALAGALAALPEPALLDQLAALWAVAEGGGAAPAPPPQPALAALGAHCEAAALASAAAHARGAGRAAADDAPQWVSGEALGWALQT